MPIPIVVVGAGVIGLTAALQLKRSNKDYDITVVANFIPGDIDIKYTSPVAGANWASFTLDDSRQKQIDLEGYHEFSRLVEDAKSGVWKQTNAVYYTQLAVDEVKGDVGQFVPWFENLANGKEIPKTRLLPGTVYGHQYDGFVISVPVYLNYLMQQCLELGVVIKRITPIVDIQEATSMHHTGRPARVVVNCAGLYASKIAGVNDPEKSFPVKGQVVHVRNTISEIRIVHGIEEPNEELYIFPRKEGGAIIGGTFLKDDWSETEDKALTQRILARAAKYAPEMLDASNNRNPPFFDVVGVRVGRRPFRESGARLERDSAKPWLVHGYGAGAGGFQGSYGFAKFIVDLVGEVLNKPKL